VENLYPAAGDEKPQLDTGPTDVRCIGQALFHNIPEEHYMDNHTPDSFRDQSVRAPADLTAIRRYLKATAAVCAYGATSPDDREARAALKTLLDLPRLLARLPFNRG
jgi:hypothetical protein